MSVQDIQTPASAAHQEDDHSNNPICKLCRRQFAKYTCPSCNVPYCSLVCFRSSSHSQCSESFYKNELQSDIASTPSRTLEERKQMMELLKRFEEDVAGDEDALGKEALGGDGDQNIGMDEEVSLVERFFGLDLHALSSEDMWEMLAPAEREFFVKALENPSSELAQRLLGTEQLEVEIEKPWWVGDREQVGPEVHGSRLQPTPIRIPQSMVKPVPHGHPLVYNMCAICIAYSYIVRHLGIRMLSTLAPSNPDFGEAIRIMALLVPFMLDRRSTTLYPSVEAVTTDIYSRFEMGKVDSELLALLLEDTAALMKPLRVVSLPSVPPQSFENKDTAFVDTSAHSLLMSILVLSDISGYYRDGQEEADKPSLQPLQLAPPLQGSQAAQSLSRSQSKQLVMKSHLAKGYSPQHAVRKLEFYAAHILATPIGIMECISDEVLRWSQKVRAEGRSTLRGIPKGVERAREPRKPLVQELD